MPVNEPLTVVVRGRNCEKYIKKCIKSVQEQTYPTRLFLWLDAPKDNSYKVASQLIQNKFIFLTGEHCGLCKSMFQSIWEGMFKHAMVYGIDKNSSIGILDADDWLERDAAEIVMHEYRKRPECLLTYGSYIKESKGRKTKISQPYPKDAKVRKYPWRASHFKTFRAKLFLCLGDKDFKDNNGKWLMAASDLALMIPMMEIAGLDRCRHISKPIYHWRDHTPYKTNKDLQQKCEAIIRAKKPYERWKYHDATV